MERDLNELSLKNFKLKSTSGRKRPIAGRWVSKKEVVEIQGVKIAGGCFYFFDGLIDADDERIDAATIEGGLDVARPPEFHKDHYPWAYEITYRFLSKRDRWTYLNWLASDRRLDAIESDFVWIYVFGIERRLLIDAGPEVADPEEIQDLRNELARVRGEFPRAGLHQELGSLLSYTWFLFSSSSPPEKYYYQGSFSNSFLRFRLGRVIQDGQPIDAKLAWDWFEQFGGFHPRRLRNIKPLFRRLFKLRYMQAFGMGLKIESDGSKLHLHFETMNPALDFYQGATFELPDMGRAKGPLKKLRNIADGCFSELEAYQRFVGARRKNKKSSLKAYTLLPPSLSGPKSHKKAKAVYDWILAEPRIIGWTTSLVEVSTNDLLEAFGSERPKDLGKRNLTFLCEVLDRLGFQIAPNPELHISKPTREGRVIIFQSIPIAPSATLKFHLLFIRLGMSISIDAQTRMQFLSEHIHQSDLLNDEKHSLLAYLFWLQKEVINFVGLKSVVVGLDATGRKLICDLIIQLALVENGVDKSKMKDLEKIYRLLGEDQSEIISDLHRSMAPTKKRKNHTTLDATLIKEREKETAMVKTILDNIFVDEEEGQSTDFSNSGLDAKHKAFFNVLVQRSEWTNEELLEMSRKRNMMLNGTIEVINEWAFDLTENPLVELDGSYFIDQDTLEEVRQLIGQPVESLGGSHG